MEAKTIDLRHLIRKCPECGQQYSSDSVFCPFDGTKLADVQSWAPNKDSLLGKTIDGRYHVDSVLGEGGMGTVYEVRHTTLQRSFALKVLRKDLAEDEELAARFIQEAKATAAVRHPHIVSISDFGRLDDGRPYFVMELLAGQTLSQAIRSGGGPLPVLRGARIVSKVARGLAAAHAAGVVHRDLKPENIVLVPATGEEDVRVVDFGAAMLQGATRLTKAGIVFGTPHYMSPEQAAGNPVDHRVDIYALGVIMYEMFTGKVPFEGDTYMGVLTQHLYVRPTPPSKVASMSSLGRLEAVILHALEKRPEERYQTMEELEREVMRVVQLGDADTTPSPDSRPASAARPVITEPEPPTLQEIRDSVAGLAPPSPWPLRFMIAAIAIGAVAVVAAIFWHRSKQETEEVTQAPAPSVDPAPSGSLAPVVPIVPPVVSTVASSAASTAASTAPRPTRTAPAKTASGEFKDPWK